MVKLHGELGVEDGCQELHTCVFGCAVCTLQARYVGSLVVT